MKARKIHESIYFAFNKGGNPYKKLGIGQYDDSFHIKQLKNISGEMLDSYQDFKDYIHDYYNNPGEYDIDEDSTYYKAIVWAWDESDLRDTFEKYKKLFDR